MKQQETKKLLIEGTIQVIARSGLDNATTKLIGEETGFNEVYIYRCFKSKVDLFTKTFECLDGELNDSILESLSFVEKNGVAGKDIMFVIYQRLWRFLLRNEARCRTYTRYYYSSYFKPHAMEAHYQRFQTVVEKFKPYFKSESNVPMILHHCINVMMDFAIKVYDGSLPDNTDTEEHIFRLLYASVSQYFQVSEEK